MTHKKTDAEMKFTNFYTKVIIILLIVTGYSSSPIGILVPENVPFTDRQTVCKTTYKIIKETVYLKTEVKNCHELCNSEFVDVPVHTDVEVPIKLCHIL